MEKKALNYLSAADISPEERQLELLCDFQLDGFSGKTYVIYVECDYDLSDCLDVYVGFRNISLDNKTIYAVETEYEMSVIISMVESVIMNG